MRACRRRAAATIRARRWHRRANGCRRGVIDLQRSMEHQLHTGTSALRALDARLHSLSPLAVLDRGYALVFNEEGDLVRTAAAAKPGALLTTRVADGTFTSEVKSNRKIETASPTTIKK